MASALCEGHLHGADPAAADPKLRGASALTAFTLAVGSCTFSRIVGKGTSGGSTPAAALGTGPPLLMVVLEDAEAQPVANLSDVLAEEASELRVRANGGEHVGGRSVLRVGGDAKVVESLFAQR